MQEDLLAPVWFQGYDTHWHTARRKGYSGVATLVAPPFVASVIQKGCGDSLTDTEGRVLCLDVGPILLVNTYAPHSHRALTRLEHKRSFCRSFSEFISKLRRRGKPLVVAGDLNVAFEERDLSNPAANRKNAGFLPEEREWFGQMLGLGLVDAFRIFHAESGHHTWWSMRKGVRERNIGWRLDYILVDSALASRAKSCVHWTSQAGSDHCPVSLDIDI